MFYSEQLSIQSKDSIERSKDGQINKEKLIKDIVEANLKLNEIQSIETASKVITTNNLDTN